jgi:hypothetical protein
MHARNNDIPPLPKLIHHFGACFLALTWSLTYCTFQCRRWIEIDKNVRVCVEQYLATAKNVFFSAVYQKSAFITVFQSSDGRNQLKVPNVHCLARIHWKWLAYDISFDHCHSCWCLPCEIKALSFNQKFGKNENFNFRKLF